MREEIINTMLKEKYSGTTFGNMHKEQDWYQFALCYLPPPELWSRHPELEKFRLLYKEKQISSALKQRVRETCFRYCLFLVIDNTSDRETGQDDVETQHVFVRQILS